MPGENQGVRYKKRKKAKGRSSRKIASVFVAILVVVICFAVAVIVGLVLGKKADQYANESKYDFNYEPYQSGDKTVKAVDALDYTLGESARGYIKNGEGYLSFPLRSSQGELSFSSSVVSEAGIGQNTSDISLEEEMSYVHGLGGYACAYIYSTAFDCEDKYLREIYKAYELALIREAAECGVDDILIVGLDVNADNIAEIEKYVSDAAVAAGKAPLGVLVSREIVLMTNDGVYFASRILAACDYLALDLRALDINEVTAPTEPDGVSGVEMLVDELEYYIEAYHMRMVFDIENEDLREIFRDIGVHNTQIIAE